MLLEAKEIYHLLRTNLLIQWSWGFTNPKTIVYGIQFEVNGLAFQGLIKIRKNRESGRYTLFFVNNEGKQVRKMWEVEKDKLLSVLENNIDNCDGDSWQKIKELYLIK